MFTELVKNLCLADVKTTSEAFDTNEKRIYRMIENEQIKTIKIDKKNYIPINFVNI
jgi:hypothetical protein